MEIDAITTTISTVGFPIAITMWFMLRTEKVISSNTEALNQIKVVMNDCQEKRL